MDALLCSCCLDNLKTTSFEISDQLDICPRLRRRLNLSHFQYLISVCLSAAVYFGQAKQRGVSFIFACKRPRMHSRIIGITLCKKNSEFLFSSACFWHRGSHLVPLQYRSIFSTAQLQNSWMNKIKGVFTGQKSSQEEAQVSSESFTLLRFADEMKKARKIGAFKQYIVGRSSEATFADAFEKHEAIIRYLGGVDPTGENLQSSHKQEAAKHCNCTIADVENTLAKFTWAKDAQKKIENLQKEGKPMPKSFTEVQKLMGSTPLDLAKSNLAQSGQISRNALCPCGSKKRYKWCCGKK